MIIEDLKKDFDNNFEQVIANYLLERISVDGELEFKLTMTDKTLSGCINYIISCAKNESMINSCAIVSDEKVFGWVVHYFIEDSIKEESVISNKKKERIKVEVVKPEKSVGKSIEQLSLFDEV